MNKLCPMPGCSVERITRDGPGFLHVAAHGTRPGSRCPDCGRASRAVHSRYRRRPADLPSLGRALRIDLRVRRFYCHNAACARHTFAERLPELLRPHARRTRRLAEAQGRVGVALGGEGGARLLQHLSMPASADTVLRLVRGLPLPEQEPPHVVGVDDWALRKGRTYGTIVVDLERRRVLDLLPDRTAETLAEWLRRQPQVAVAARDRSTEYARGIALGAPGARHVADRWHLLANMRQVLERWLAGAHARLRHLPPGPGAPADARAGSRTGPFRRTRAEGAAAVARPPGAAGRALQGGQAAARRRREAARDRPGDEPRGRDGAQVCLRRELPGARSAIPQVQHPGSLPRPLGDTARGRLRERADPVARVAGGRLHGNGQAGAPLARGAPEGAGSEYSPQVAGRTARHQADAGQTRPSTRLALAGAAGVAARPTPSGVAGVRCSRGDTGRAGPRGRDRGRAGPPVHGARARERHKPEG